MRALVFVLCVQYVLTLERQDCNPGYYNVNVNHKKACFFCICREENDLCNVASPQKCWESGNLDIINFRSLRRKRSTPVLKITDTFSKYAVQKRNANIDDQNAERTKQHEIYIKNSNAKVFNARKQNNPVASPNDENFKPINEVSLSYDEIDNANEIFSDLLRKKPKDTGKILEDHQTLALIRNSRSRVIKTGNTMSVNSQPRFVRSHKKENGVKLNIKQKRTSYKKDLSKKFKNQSHYRKKRQVKLALAKPLDDKINDFNDITLPTTEMTFTTSNNTDVYLLTTVSESPLLTSEPVSENRSESTGINTNNIDYNIKFTDTYDAPTGKSVDMSEQNTNPTTEARTDITRNELYYVTDNVEDLTEVTSPSTIDIIQDTARTLPENEISFNHLSQTDNVAKMFQWSRDDINQLDSKNSILMKKFKRFFRKKTSLIRAKPFTVDKEERLYVTNVPNPNSIVVGNDHKTIIATEKFRHEVFKNITNLQFLLKGILKRLKEARTSTNVEDISKNTNFINFNKIHNETIWKLKENERKIKKQSKVLTGYKNIGICELNSHRKNVIKNKVIDLHNQTKNIFDTIEYLKNIQINNFTNDHNLMKSKTDKLLKSISNFIILLNEIVNTATCKRNIKLQRILRHIGRHHSHNTKINEALSKMKSLIQKYRTVQNNFVSKMYEVIQNFDDHNGEAVDKVANITKSNNTSDMDTIANKIANNLKRLKDLVQTLNKSRRAKRDTIGDDTTEMLLLIEYILKQKLAVRRPPVEDGIDALIEAIRKAPDVKTVKNEILGLNTTNLNSNITKTDLLILNKDKTLPNVDKKKPNEPKLRVSKHIIRPKEKDDSEAISDISSDENNDSRLGANNLNSKDYHFITKDTERLETELRDLDFSIENYGVLKPVETDIPANFEVTTENIVKKMQSDSVEETKSNDQFTINILDNEDTSTERNDSAIIAPNNLKASKIAHEMKYQFITNSKDKTNNKSDISNSLDYNAELND